MKRLLYLLKIYILLVLTFMAAKVAFMLFNREGHDFSMGDVWDVLRHGLSLDLSTALYFLIIPFLVVIVSLWWKRTDLLQKHVLRYYYFFIATILALAFVADSSLYPFWGFKLDAACLQFLSTPGDAFTSVSWGYILMRLISLIGLMGLMGWLFTRPKLPTEACQHRWLFTILLVALIPFIVLGIRGGTGESTTNIGQVYYSQNQFLNHSAINPVFSFFASFEKTAGDIVDYKYMDEAECKQILANCFPTTSTDTDTLLTTQTPNIIVILMESAGGIFTEIGGRTDIMPNLNRLAHEGINFTNCYGNTWRTDRGTLCTWSGYPSFPRSSLMKMPAKTRFLPGIAKSLLKEGYHTSYIYGGDINFTNMRSYLVTIGFDQFCWMKDYTMEQQRTSKWGVRDDITFATLYDQITAPKANGTHRLIGYSTLSSHEPWDVPTHRLSEEIPNAFNYLDECLGNFIDKMKQTPQWDNLLVILLPDHGYSYFGVDETHELHDHVPMLWLGGALRGPRRVEQFCNQTDLPATLLGQMGLPHDDYLFSRDVMSRNYTYPFVVHTYNNGITMKDSTGFAVYDLNVNRIIVDKSTDAQKLIRRGMAILQTASEHIRQQK